MDTLRLEIDPATARFSLGQTVITPAAMAALTPDEVLVALKRHVTGDWGECCPEDAAQNDAALRWYRDECRAPICTCHDDSAPAYECGACGCGTSGRILSSYTIKGVKFWIITEADRSVTTVLLPQDY